MVYWKTFLIFWCNLVYQINLSSICYTLLEPQFFLLPKELGIQTLKSILQINSIKAYESGRMTTPMARESMKMQEHGRKHNTIQRSTGLLYRIFSLRSGYILMK